MHPIHPQLFSSPSIIFSPTWYLAIFWNCLGKYAIFIFCRKIFDHWHYVQNFNPGDETLSKIQSDPSLLGYRRFFKCLRKSAIWVYVEKYFNITILFKLLPGLMKRYWKFNPTFLHCLRTFFKCLRKSAIWVYVEKYFNIAILFKLLPRLMKQYWKFNPTLLRWASAFFFFKCAARRIF